MATIMETLRERAADVSSGRATVAEFLAFADGLAAKAGLTVVAVEGDDVKASRPSSVPPILGIAIRLHWRLALDCACG